MSKVEPPKQTKKQRQYPSRMTKQLYGGAYAAKVHQRLQNLDPELNAVIQRIPYDQFWSRPGLSMRDKALVTVAALIAMGKEEQTRIHMTGFLNIGGTVEELRNALIHLAIYCGFPATINGFSAMKEVVETQGTKSVKGTIKKRK